MSKKWLCSRCGRWHHIMETRCSAEKDDHWDLMISTLKDHGIEPAEFMRFRDEDNWDKALKRLPRR